MNYKTFIKNTFAILGILIVGGALYAATIRGVAGNPQAADFKNGLDQAAMPFELSPERGRFAHVYALAENNTYTLTKTWADIVHPDAGVIDGRYYSFFAPGVSYITAPFYSFGKVYNVAQVATFAGVALISLCGLVFIYLLAREAFKLPVTASLLAVLSFAFASTAWSYAVTLYQHHFTVFFIASGLYAVWKYGKGGGWRFLWAFYVGVIYAAAIMVDYPNALLMLPVMFYLAFQAIGVTETERGYKISLRYSALVFLTGFIVITGFHFYHNATYFGGWSKLAGGLPTYKLSGEMASTTPVVILPTATTTLSGVSSTTGMIATSTKVASSTEEAKSIASFFSEDQMYVGFITLFFSFDRGIFIYWPIVILAIYGIYAMRNKLEAVHWTMLGLVGMNIFLYASWGDPWGGWAYGPRYLILSMSMLSMFAAAGVYYGKYWIMHRLAAFILIAYSACLALLGALTTNAVPPKFEALYLPIKNYGFMVNYAFLSDGRSSSYVYNTFLQSYLTLDSYFVSILAVVLVVALALLVLMPINKNHE